MNRGVLESPPVQQLVAAGNPDWWWNVNGIRAPRPTAIPPFLSAAAVSNYSPSLVVPPYAPIPPSSSSWQDYTQELPESWSQLLLGGLAGDEEEDRKSGISNFQAKRLETWQEQEAKRLETWQEQALEYSPYVSSAMENVKQENSTSSYLYEHSNDQDFHLGAVKSSASNWSSLTSSPKSCIASYKLNNNVLDFSKMNKSSAKHPPPSRSAESNSNAAGGSQKKARVQSSSTQSTFKVRKEKLGDRITALHQLVSPFGKTDTASVLLEAIGYIRFLQSQIEALSLPYLGRNPGNLRHKVQDQDQRNCIFPEDPGQLLNENGKRRKGAPDQQECVGEDRTKDLRSRGLCLVPISCTLQVGSETSNGADYWAPASLGGGGGGGFL